MSKLSRVAEVTTHNSYHGHTLPKNTSAASCHFWLEKHGQTEKNELLSPYKAPWLGMMTEAKMLTNHKTLKQPNKLEKIRDNL